MTQSEAQRLRPGQTVYVNAGLGRFYKVIKVYEAVNMGWYVFAHALDKPKIESSIHCDYVFHSRFEALIYQKLEGR